MDASELIMDLQDMIGLVRRVTDDERILTAMRLIDRGHFVERSPYLDQPQHIGHDQTISQPSTVAMQLEMADLQNGQDVLEVGAGSGWNACLLGYMVGSGEVLSLDVIPDLVREASKNKECLQRETGLDLSNVSFRHDNIFEHIESHDKTYDRIIITAGMQEFQRPLIRRLAERLLREDGLLLCPYANGPIMTYRKNDGGLEESRSIQQYRFVPLITPRP